MVREREVITHKAYARVGLLGNPSDVYYGKTISFSLANFSATVTLRPSPELVIQPHPVHDLVHFSSLPQLVPIGFFFRSIHFFEFHSLHLLRFFEFHSLHLLRRLLAGYQVELRGLLWRRAVAYGCLQSVLCLLQRQRYRTQRREFHALL